LRRVSALASFVSGRRTKWVVIALWIAAVVALAPLGAKLGDVTRDETASFLPAEAESTKVQELLKDRFPGGETGIGLIVYRRKGGLTEADQARIARDARAVDEAIPVSRPAQVPFGPGATPGLVSERGDAAYTVITVPLDFDKAADWGNETRDLVRPSQGLETFVTGDLGLFADFDEVFGEVDTRLLLATVALVLILLGLIYRAPLIAIVPIVVVALSYQIASGFIYLYADAGNSVNSNATSILVVLMFGVGTDYCLLLVSRYREELHRVQDKHEAMARALRRAGPAVLASGCTVVTAMLVLLLAESGSTNALGPVSAIGVACVLLAGLTLLPALLTIFGRRGFWPRKRVVAYNPDVDVEERCGLRRRFGDRVLQRPAAALAATTALFAFLRPRAPVLQGGLLDRRLLQDLGRERRRLQRARAVVPAGRARAYDDPRAARGRARHGRRRGRRAGATPRGRRRRRGRRAGALRGRRHRQIRRHVQRRPLFGRGARSRGHPARSIARPPRRSHRARGRRQRRAAGPQRRRRARPAGHRSRRAAGHRRHPRCPPAGDRRADRADRDGDGLLPRHARALDLLLHRDPGQPGRRRVAAHVRVHLPRGARGRLHDLPDEPRARGGPASTGRARASCVRWPPPVR
jgi:hypothetical protein